MAYTIQDVIDRAKIYVDDNHKVTDGWKQPADWLAMIRPELAAVYRKWVRESLISFNTLDGIISNAVFTWPDTAPPLAILGVAQQVGTQFRMLQYAQSYYGRNPFWEAGTPSIATTWTSVVDTNPAGDGNPVYSLAIHPPDPAAGYLVRYIKFPDMSALDKFVILPEGHEDYLALRLAKKALASEGASSQAIERLIIQAESDIKMEALSNAQGDGPRVRIVRPFNKQRLFNRYNSIWPTSPMLWFYP